MKTFQIYIQKFILNYEFMRILNLLNNCLLMENIMNFFKNEFWQSNNKIEKIYNLEINKFLI